MGRSYASINAFIPSATLCSRTSAAVLAGYHQGDHRIWLYDNSTQSYARRYLQLRYKMAPSLISAGRTLQSAGFPLTARCDLVFPEYAEAKDPTQYLHLNSSLVAPLDEDASTRQVWIPP